MNCFIIMPFSETIHSHNDEVIKISDSEWSHIYEQWIKKAVESFPKRKITCKRSEAIQGNFVKGIIQDIHDADIAIADLTGQKPNVYYELGIRHALKLGTITMTQDFSTLPSDLKSYYCFSYEYSNKTHEYNQYYDKFESNLHLQIQSLLENQNKSDNPVSDFLNLTHYFQVQEKEHQVKQLLIQVGRIQQILADVIQKFTAELSYKEDRIKKPKIFFTFLDFYYMDNLVSQLFNVEFNNVDSEVVENLRAFYLDLRKDLFSIHQWWQGTVSNLHSGNIKILMEMLEEFLSRKDQIITNLKANSDNIIKEVNQENI